MNDDPVTINCQLTNEDYAKMSADIAVAAGQNDSNYVSSRQKMIQVMIAWLIFVVIVFIGEICFRGWSGWSDYIKNMSVFGALFNAAVGLLLSCALITQYNKSLYQKYYDCTLNILNGGKNKSYLAPTTYVLSKEIILNNSEYSESRIKWSCIEKVVLQGGDLCLFLSSAAALYIPHRFFSSNEEKLAAYHKCKRWFDAAQAAEVG